MRNETWLRWAGWLATVVLVLVAGRVAHAHEPLKHLLVRPASDDGRVRTILFVSDAEDGEQDATAETAEDVLVFTQPGGKDRPVVVELDDDAAADAPAGGRWIGILCRSNVEEALRTHLELSEGRGLQIQEVVEDSPAAEAGLKKYDILLSVGDQELNDLSTLVEAVKSAEGELKLVYLRAGQRHTVSVQPSKRPRPRVARTGEANHLRLAPGVDWVPRVLGDIDIDLENGPGKAVITRFLGPGVVFPPHGEFPDDLEVTITKKGKAPATIVVQRGDDRWETTADKLGKLPEDVRGHVESLLGRWPRGAGSVRFQPTPGQAEIDVEVEKPDHIIIEVPGADDEDGRRTERRRIIGRIQPPARDRGDDDRYERRFRQLDERLERFERLIERLHDRAGDEHAPVEDVDVEDVDVEGEDTDVEDSGDAEN